MFLNILLATIVFLVTLATGFGGGYLMSPKEQVVRAQNVGNANLVTYTNGKTDITVVDNFGIEKSGVPSRYHFTLPPQWFNDQVGSFPIRKVPYVPTMTIQGGSWEREVWVYDDAQMPFCQRNILYVDRVNHEFHVSQSAMCIERALDQKGITHFLARTHYEKNIIGFGEYNTGKILASKTLPDGQISTVDAITDWELDTMAVVVVFDCGPTEECRLPIVALWNLKTNTWSEKKTISTSEWNQRRPVLTVNYDHDKDEFSLFASVNGVTKKYVLK